MSFHASCTASLLYDLKTCCFNANFHNRRRLEILSSKKICFCVTTSLFKKIVVFLVKMTVTFLQAHKFQLCTWKDPSATETYTERCFNQLLTIQCTSFHSFVCELHFTTFSCPSNSDSLLRKWTCTIKKLWNRVTTSDFEMNYYFPLVNFQRCFPLSLVHIFPKTEGPYGICKLRHSEIINLVTVRG